MSDVRKGPTDFEATTSHYRRELLAHCYRMTGSVQEAEDLVQETYLRAWRAFDRFEARSSVRTWLYRIATNVCLSALDRGRSRPLPSGLGPPSLDPNRPPAPASPELRWLEPIPDRLVVDERADPAEVMASRHAVRLALVAALQALPPRQRAAWLLCEVADTPLAEASATLDISVAALKSLLQRARKRIDELSVTEDGLAEPTDVGAVWVLDRYLAAFINSDLVALTRLLSDDAILEMTGTTTWFRGKATCELFLAGQAIGRAGDWRMLALRANGQLAAAAYRRDDYGSYHPFAIVVLATTSTAITRISLFSDPRLFPWFLPDATLTLPGAPAYPDSRP
jgi:RNA polymerase sigma-70 factor (ECF subfamily)